MAVHRRVEQPPRIRLIVPGHDPGRAQRVDRDPRRAVVLIVEDADLPGPRRIGRGFEPWGKAVHRHDQVGPRLVDHRRQPGMIGAVIIGDARGAPGGIERGIAGNGMAVACNRDQRGMILLAVQVDHQPRHRAEQRPAAQPVGKQFGHRRRANVPADMALDQRRIDAEIDARRHMGGGMIDNDQRARPADAFAIGARHQPCFIR